jgi:hypothetical protein
MVLGGQDAEECSSKYGIRYEPLLGLVVFGFTSLVFRLYTAPLFCSSAFSSLRSSCATTDYIINYILPLKKTQRVKQYINHSYPT